jgi:hypothetical protein
MPTKYLGHGEQRLVVTAAARLETIRRGAGMERRRAADPGGWASYPRRTQRDQSRTGLGPFSRMVISIGAWAHAIAALAISALADRPGAGTRRRGAAAAYSGRSLESVRLDFEERGR